MSNDKKPEKREITYDFLMADMMLRLTSLEQLLLNKGVVTREELVALTEVIAKKASEAVLEKAKASKDINDFVSNLTGSIPPKESDQKN